MKFPSLKLLHREDTPTPNITLNVDLAAGIRLSTNLKEEAKYRDKVTIIDSARDELLGRSIEGLEIVSRDNRSNGWDPQSMHELLQLFQEDRISLTPYGIQQMHDLFETLSERVLPLPDHHPMYGHTGATGHYNPYLGVLENRWR